MRLSPDIRGAFTKLVKKGLAVTRIAELFDATDKPCTDGLTEPNMWGQIIL